MRFKNFFTDESGAVTVDWVVITAGVVVLGVIVLAPFGDSTVSVATNLATVVQDTPVAPD